ncbi:hypothetical protein pipiens_013748 [Culex pipiens pipiens]|uniref:Uncharacterized protein n=1 Tax=Culex pipiens pipiens TaxID=38569 RepID=A0ABD1CYF5_CULPP
MIILTRNPSRSRERQSNLNFSQAARLPRKKESGGINKVNFSVTVAVAPKIPCMDKLDEKSRKKPPLNNPLIVVPSRNWRKTYVYVIHPKDCYLKTRLDDQKVDHLTSVQ